MTDAPTTAGADPGAATRGGAADRPGGVLAALERIGNRLPNPFWLFVILALAVIASSWAGAAAGLSATDPAGGGEIRVESLLTAEYASRMITDAVVNFTSFAPLGLILVCMLGVAVAEYSGFIGAAVRAAVGRIRGGWPLTFVIALAGVTGSVASDAVYVILIPLGAAAFRSVGRNPVVGAMVAFAASSAGFNSSLVLNITDVLLAGISTSAAGFVDPGYVVSPLSNYFFSMASAVVLSIIITGVTELFVNAHAARTMHEDEIDYEAAAFTKPGAGADGAAGGAGAPRAGGDPASAEELAEELTLDPVERRGLIAGTLAGAAVLAAWSAALFIPGSPLRGPGDGILDSPLLTDIVVPIAVLFAAVGIAYGVRVGSIRGSADVPAFMERGLGTLTTMLVLFFAVAQFTAYFDWSNLGRWTAIRGAELLTRADLPPLALFAALVLLVAALNLFITSGSAQWALMAPVVVPMLMYVGIAPEVTQMLFRIGDSPTNIITPMSPYFALALTFLQKYRPASGVGTLMSLTIPYSLAMLLGWFAFFVVWYLLGIDLGPGVAVR